MFADMQRDYHWMKEEHAEALWAATKYREDLHVCKSELKGASEVVTSYKHSLIALEKEKEYADHEKDRARADLERANIA